MMMSDLRPEVEMWLLRAYAMKSMQYNRYYRNSSVIVELAMGQIPRSRERYHVPENVFLVVVINSATGP